MTTLILNTRKLELFLLLVFTVSSISCVAQTATSSVLVNFGRQSCGLSTSGSDITLFDKAQSLSPGTLLQCNTSLTIGDVYSKFISYNSINNKLYINDISDGANSKMYILNLGIPTNVTCPVVSGVSYTISNVVLSQFEFDPLGDLYALSLYNPATGHANLGAYDDTTGQLKPGSLKTIIFPAGHFPTDVDNGDVAILPNGRMFCVFGGDTSKLFEVTNYKKTDVGNAIATFLGTPAKVCYGLAFDNGYLLMGGNLGGPCYSFTYNLSTHLLSPELSTPVGSMPIDYASFTPSIGIGQKIVSAVQVDATHYDLTYQIFVKNIGNVKIGDAQIKENFGTLFGAGNISNVTTSFISNGGALILNPSFNGSSDMNLLNSSESLVNYPANKISSLIQVSLRVASPIPLQLYKTSAVFSGKIGQDSTLLTLLDSSNNYTSAFPSWDAVVDPNYNNVADDPGEGLPTPWSMGMILPIELSTFDVHTVNAGASLNWTTLSEVDNRYFAIERSTDAIHFDSIGIVSGSGTSTMKHDYSFIDSKLPKISSYYRLRQVANNGTGSYSEVRVIEGLFTAVSYSIYPNPASNHLVFASSGTSDNDLNLDISNLYGVNVFSKSIPAATMLEQISLPQLANGYYVVTIKNPDGAISFFKISINN